MNKRSVFLLIPIIIISGYVIFTWIQFARNDYTPNGKHYAALIGALVLVCLFFIHRKACLIATCVFLWIGIAGVFSLTRDIVTVNFGVGQASTPDFNGLCLGIFVIYLILNGGTLNRFIRDPKKAIYFGK
jgi:hypothetical protein